MSPYDDCATGDSHAKFLGELPPNDARAGELQTVSVTFANCSGATWIRATSLDGPGIKLGSQAPQDNSTWGQTRFLLPGDVPHNFKVEIRFTVVPPGWAGPYSYRWGLVDEGVTWITDAFSPAHTIGVSPLPTTLCPGVTVERGGASAAAGIQACIDALPAKGTLELPPGQYRMGGSVVLNKEMTFRTTGTAASTTTCLRDGGPACAWLVAAADLDVENGFFQIDANYVRVEHIVLHGNRGARLGSSAAAVCASGYNRKGFNAIARGDWSSFRYNASIAALCGTGMEWGGNLATITKNFFWANGDHATTNMWADGLTAIGANLSKIMDNEFLDNTDIDLIIGDGVNTTVSGNVIWHRGQATFAGLMLDNFNGGTPGNFSGGKITNNQIDCGNRLCSFGINIGPHAWYLSAHINGGEVSNNVVYGAKIGLNADGAGTAAAPVTITANTVTGSPSSAGFSCGARNTANCNIGPDSVITGNTAGCTKASFHICH